MSLKKSVYCLASVLGLILCLAAGARAAEPVSPLAEIAKSGTVKQLAEAIAAGADVDEANEFGLTLLMLTTFDESRGVAKAKLLLNAGADPHISTAEGDTALHFAAGQGEVGLLAMLLAYVDPDDVNDLHETPLMIALRNPEEFRGQYTYFWRHRFHFQANKYTVPGI